MKLSQYKRAGVLPLLVTEGNKTIELIICDSISGGSKETNNMPNELSLLRILEDGTEYRQRYVQKRTMKLSEYSDEDLLEEVKHRGFKIEAKGELKIYLGGVEIGTVE